MSRYCDNVPLYWPAQSAIIGAYAESISRDFVLPLLACSDVCKQIGRSDGRPPRQQTAGCPTDRPIVAGRTDGRLDHHNSSSIPLLYYIWLTNGSIYSEGGDSQLQIFRYATYIHLLNTFYAFFLFKATVDRSPS